MSILLYILTVFAVLATALPFVPSAHGLARSFDFPRLQILVVCVVLCGATMLFLPGGWIQNLMVAIQVLCFSVQAAVILPYTRLWRPQSVVLNPAAAHGRPTIKLLLSNVLQHSDDYAGLIGHLKNHDPDICIFMETDVKWHQALRDAGDTYGHRIEQIQDNTYGIMLWSKLEIVHGEVRYLVNDAIPSIKAQIRLEDGTSFALYAVHPEPPRPANHTVERDAEIVIVGLEAARHDGPVIVSGDLNDVAWSRTTSRFRRASKLLDPRIGHALQNTFHAHYWFLRWPLDHVFHSDEFSLVELRRLPAYGSDHFPLLCELALDPESCTPHPPDDLHQDDIAEVKELIGLANDPEARWRAEDKLKE